MQLSPPVSETMADQFVEAYIDKLILLEEKTGATVGYHVMSPLTTPFHDCLEIQAVAKQIAKSIGLEDLTFIIAITKQEEKVGAILTYLPEEKRSLLKWIAT